MSVHVVAAVDFIGHRLRWGPEVSEEDAPLTCRCGWQGVVRDWTQHRLKAGQKAGRRTMPGERTGLPFRLHFRPPQ
jgi:hypothetical protein